MCPISNNTPTGKHSFLPTAIIAVVYFTSDFFLDGLVAVAIIVGAGVLEFLYFRIFRNTVHRSVLIEGFVLGGIVLGGGVLEQAGYKGAEFPIIELILAGTLIISALAGSPWLEKMMKRQSGISVGIDKYASYCFGTLFAVHGSVLSGMIILHKRIFIIPAISLFIILYMIAFIVVRKKNKRKVLSNMPILKELTNGIFSLSAEGVELGSIHAVDDRVFSISEVSIGKDCETHNFLNKLETALSIRGIRTIKFINWKDDTIQLEMGGYRKIGEFWQKPIVK